MSESAIREYMQSYSVFSERLSEKAYLLQIERINWQDGNLLRACSQFRLAQRCMSCERTLTLALLCSSIEAMNPKYRQIDFYSWLIKNRLDLLEMKSTAGVKKNLQAVHEEWLKLPDRAGAFFGFKRFLLDNCPTNLRLAPITDNQNQYLPFEDSLKIIYDLFRSFFVHEGYSYASFIPDFVDSASHVLLIENHLYFIDLKLILPWFSDVVKQSLINYLITAK
jgi:hypothetical protein